MGKTDQAPKAPSFKRPGLVLDMPGAPATPHEIPGLSAELRPDLPTPLEQCGLTLAEARKLDADEGFPAALVEMTEKEASDA